MRIKAQGKCAGANAVEYGLVLAIIVALMISAAQFLNTPIKAFFVNSAQCVTSLLDGGDCGGSVAATNQDSSQVNNSNSSIVGATASGQVNIGSEPFGLSASIENGSGGGFPFGLILPPFVPVGNAIDFVGDIGSGAQELVEDGRGLLAAGIRLDGDLRGLIVSGSFRLAGETANFGLGVLGDGIGLGGDVVDTGTELLGAGIEGLGDIADGGSDIIGGVSPFLPIPGGQFIGEGIEVAGDLADIGSEIISDDIVAAGDLANQGADFLDNGADVVGDLIDESTDVVGEAVALLPVTRSEIIALAVEGNDTGDALGSDRVAEQAGEALVELVDPGFIVENEFRGNNLERKPLSDLNLTNAQKAELENVFGDNIDFANVEVIVGEGGILDEVLEGRPLVAGNTILLNGLDPHASQDAWADFMHELVHVWQFQNGGADYAPEAVYAQQLGQGYNVARAFDGSNSVQFGDLNPEQQAEIILTAQSTGYIADRESQEIYIRVKDVNSTSGYEKGFESAVIDSTDASAISVLEADGWINVSPTVDDALTQLSS